MKSYLYEVKTLRNDFYHYQQNVLQDVMLNENVEYCIQYDLILKKTNTEKRSKMISSY